MAEIPPHSHGIDPNAQPWARWVTERSKAHGKSIDSLVTNQQSQNKSIAAQLNRLQEQIADLNERRTYTLLLPVTLTTTTPYSYASYFGNDKIDFTLRNDARVRVSGSARLSGFGNGADGGVSGSIGMYVDTYPFPYPSDLTDRMSGFSSVSSSGGNMSFDTSIYFSTTIDLGAGNHTAYPLGIDTYGQFFGTSGSVTLSSIFYAVEVIGTS